MSQGKSKFRVLYQDSDMGEFHLPLPGIHNISNALASIGVAIELDIKTEDARTALGAFSGVERRFQVAGRIRGRETGKGEAGEIMVVDDYGHHPTEIRATLSAAKEGWGKKTLVIFQPHRYTRTRDMLDEFADAFDSADVLIITDIYPAGERPIEGVTAERLYETIRRHGHPNVMFMPDKTLIPARVYEIMRPGDMIITLGAGDIWKTGRKILSDYKDS